MHFSREGGRALVLALLCGGCVIAGQARASYGVDETAIEWVNRASKIAPASVDAAFGEKLSLYDGTVEFNAVDISLPGIGPAVEVRRSFPVRDTNIQMETGIPQGSGERKELGDWSLDLPHLSGVYEALSGWQVDGDSPYARCSSGTRPKRVSLFEADEYWSGNDLHVPGEVSEGLLLNYNTARPSPTDGKSYPWTTKSGWMISCTPSTANGYPGEGFVATSPDGTRYYLDWVVKRPYPGLTGPQYYSAFSGEYNIARIGRNKIYFLASKVVDRFGNQVTYHYTGDLLTSITASDGRSITLGYNSSQRLTSVSAGSQTYRYAYTGDYLQTVTLPDASKWTYARAGVLSIWHESGMELQNQTKCMAQAPMGEDFTYAVTNPAGLTGSFKFHITGHNKRNVPEYCKSWQYGKVGKITTVRYWQIPLRSTAYSLVQKDVSGIGMPTATWTYDYNTVFMGLGSVGFHDDCVADPSVCPLSKTVLVNGPSRFERYTFGIWWGVNDGQLLKKEVGTSSDDILYVEDYTYISEAEAAQLPFGDRVGSQIHGYLDDLGSQNRPLQALVKTQQAATFRRANLTYDVFARPTSVQVSSSLGYSMTDAIAYFDQTAKWVIGQPRRRTCTAPSLCAGVVVSRTDYDLNSALPVRQYAFGKLQQTLSYYADGTVAAVQDGAGHRTNLSGWKRGIPQKVTYPATPDQPTPVSRTAVVDNNGWITSLTDEAGAKTCYEYDAMGRVKKITYPSEAQSGVCDTSTWAPTTISFVAGNPAAYGLPAGHWRQTTLTGNARKIVIFDALWRPVVDQTLDLGNVSGTNSEVIRRYDDRGRLAFESYPMNTVGHALYTDPALKGTHTTYDALDRVTRVERDSELGTPLVTTTQYQNGFRTLVTEPNGNQTLTTLYRAFDEPTYDFPKGINHPEGTYTEIYRDVFGKPTALVRRNATSSVTETRRYVYNAFQELCKTIEPETGTTLQHYDASGNVDWSASGLNLPSLTSCDEGDPSVSARRVSRTYDARNRLLSLSFPDGRGNQVWSYAPDGQPAQAIAYNASASGTPVVTDYVYNRRGLLTRESVTQTGWYTWNIGYGYDANGHLSSQSYPSGLVVDYAPNALGQPTLVGNSKGSNPFAWAIAYYPNGALKHFRYGNGILHTLEQNDRLLPERSRDAYEGDAAVLDLSYDYDGNGNVMAISDITARADRLMTYDGLDRLTSVQSPMYSAIADQTARYAYDALDNLTRVIAPGRNDYYCYDTVRWQLTNIKTGSCTGATREGLDYDEQGNLSNRSGHDYDFDFGNRLRLAGYAGTAVETYRYDALGRRVLAWSPTEGSILSQYTRDGQLLYQNDQRRGKRIEYAYLAGSLVGRHEEDTATGAGAYRFYHTDALGSPVAVTDGNRKVVERSEYEPYGKLLNRPLADGPGYTGHVGDAATGLSYMQQRYYDPGIGRFLSVDPVSVRPIGDNFNRYWYANNNPYTNTDPDGRECNGNGCWVTPEERAAAASGDWKGYYQMAGAGGDKYAQRAGDVASNTGSTPLNAKLSAITNKILADSIATNMGADPQNMTTNQQVAVAFKMEDIRVDLAQAHVQALDDAGASPSNPISLDRAVIGEFHKEVFKANGADPGVFGGFKVDAVEKAVNVFGGTTRDIYDYCPKPSCSN